MLGRELDESAEPGWRRFAALLSWALLLLTADPWGTDGQIGGALAVVKVCGFLAAVLLASASARPLARPRLVGWLLMAYAATAAAGALLSQDQVSESLVRSGRLAMVAVVATWLARTLSLMTLMRVTVGMSVGVSATALIGRYSGPAELFDGRLAGYLPPLHPNGLATWAGIGATLCAVLWLTHNLRGAAALACMVPLTVTLVLAQSRTALLATLGGLLVSLFIGHRKRSVYTAFTVGLVGSLTAAVAALSQWSLNPLAGSRLRWDATFTGRTEGWRRVLEIERPWPSPAIGDGLAVKYVRDINVHGGLRPVDGTWHSAYLEAGFLGLILLIAVVLLVAMAALRTPTSRTTLPVLAWLLLSSALENVLNDVNFALVILAGIASALPARPAGPVAPAQDRAHIGSARPFITPAGRQK